MGVSHLSVDSLAAGLFVEVDSLFLEGDCLVVMVVVPLVARYSARV